MAVLSRRSLVVTAFAALAITTGVSLGTVGWLQPDWTLSSSGLILVALLTSALAMRHVTAKDWSTMLPSFVADLTTLLLLGPDAMTVVATAGAIMQGLSDQEQQHRIRRVSFNVVTAVAAAQAAGLAHQFLGGTIGAFKWPEQGLPIALAVSGYCVVKSTRRKSSRLSSPSNASTERGRRAFSSDPRLFPRRQCCRGTGHDHRPPNVGTGAGGSRTPVLRVPRVPRFCRPAR